MSAGGYAALSPRFASTAIGAAILQLAAGRVPPALKSQALSPMELTEVTAAAQAYVAHVMLAPSSDLLGILGVADDFTPGELRDNYRRLMALVHPDARPVGFPDDAASRVNKAFATLSDDAMAPPSAANHPARRRRSSRPRGRAGCRREIRRRAPALCAGIPGHQRLLGETEYPDPLGLRGDPLRGQPHRQRGKVSAAKPRVPGTHHATGSAGSRDPDIEIFSSSPSHHNAVSR